MTMFKVKQTDARWNDIRKTVVKREIVTHVSSTEKVYSFVSKLIVRFASVYELFDSKIEEADKYHGRQFVMSFVRDDGNDVVILCVEEVPEWKTYKIQTN